MKKIKVSIQTVNTKTLKANAFLEKYGINKLSDFEMKQYKNFDLNPGQPLVTEDGSVLCNWAAVEYAQKVKCENIEVLVISGLTADQVIQVVSLKNMGRKLSRMQISELIVELRTYLDENPTGILWKAEIPGENVTMKMGFLIGYSYGMTSNLQKIYKYNPNLLQKIDEGEMTFNQALELSKAPVKSEPEPATAAPGSQPELGGITPPLENVPGWNPSIPFTIPNTVGNTANQTVDNAEENNRNEDEEPIQTNLEAAPIPVNTPSWTYAGEKQMVPCERPIGGITVRYLDGTSEEMVIVNNKAIGNIGGKPTKELEYNGGLYQRSEDAVYHSMTTDGDRSGITLTLWNKSGLAA